MKGQEKAEKRLDQRWPGGQEGRVGTPHVWKPLPSDSTVSLQRAQRWQQSAVKSTPASTAPAESARSASPSPPRSTSPQRAARRIGDGGVGSPAVVVQSVKASAPLPVPDITVDESLKATWCSGQRRFEPGKLRSIHSQGLGTGMSHPPQNPQVQRELLAYLQAYKVKPRGEAKAEPKTGQLKPGQRPSKPQPSKASPPKQKAQQHIEGKQSVPERSGSAPALAATRRKVASLSSTMPQWLHRSQPQVPQQGSMTLPLLTEDQVERRMKQFRSTSREQGWELGRKSQEDLGNLTMYHNQISRRLVPSAHQVHQKADLPVEQLRELNGWMVSPSSAKVADELGVTLRPTSPGKVNLDMEMGGTLDEGNAGPKWILSLAGGMKRASPNTLQRFARATGVSMLTGMRQHENFLAEAGNA